MRVIQRTSISINLLITASAVLDRCPVADFYSLFCFASVSSEVQSIFRILLNWNVLLDKVLKMNEAK